MKSFDQWKERHPFMRETLSFVYLFAKCYVFVWILTSYVIKPIHVEGSSMYPTYENGNIGITNIIDKEINGVQRFDVVIVDSPFDTHERWIKRVIALPNETISYHDDVLYINGNPIKEDFLDESYVDKKKQEYHVSNFTEDFGPITLGKDEYFVMGDNRRDSQDSRFVGSFQMKHILGKDAYIILK